MINYKLISKTAQKYKKDIVEFLRDIVAIPSLSTKEEKVVERIAQEMKNIGYDEVIIDPMGNIFGNIGKGKKVIVFDGHIDTVGVGDPALWKVDPFIGKYEKGLVYGRGSADQKGGFASAVYAGKILKDLKLIGDYTFYACGSIMEEDCDGLNWQFILKSGRIKPDVVVLTESTSLKVYRGQRGRMEIEITTKGLSCHGSAPERGINAIYMMAPIIKDIEKSAIDEIKKLPSFKKEKAEIKVLDYKEKSYKDLVFPTKKYYPMWTVPENGKEVQIAVKAYEGLYGKKPKIGHWVFSTNGIATMGMHKIPTIGFGPGDEKQAHSPNENIPAQDLVEAMKFYVAFTLEYC